jgi:Tfp pilus assembly protein PilE
MLASCTRVSWTSYPAAMDRTTGHAELAAIGDGLERYYHRIGGLVTSMATGGEREALADVLASLHEVERSLKSAERGIQRALKLLA